MTRKRALKVWRFICGLTALLGFMVMLGTAGSSDLDLIPFSQIVKQSLIGLGMVTGGLWLGGFME